MTAKTKSLPDLERIRANCRRALQPMEAATNRTAAPKDLLFSAIKLVDASALPEPHFLFLLLVDLLGFNDLGRFEKLAWSVPIDVRGQAFLVEHRKFGVGVFGRAEDREIAKQIAERLRKAVKCARPYFEGLAREAVSASQFNIVNHARPLFERYEFYREKWETLDKEATARKDEWIVTKHKNSTTMTNPSFRLAREAEWLGTSAIDAFFSWTEHAFVLIAVLSGKVTTGEAFSALSGAEWGQKFKSCLDIADADTKRHYDALTELRRANRNFIAHGAFGKDGETLRFHSRAGPIPALLDWTKARTTYAVAEDLSFAVRPALHAIAVFVKHLWSGSRQPAFQYIQEWNLPIIMTMVHDGKYASAMAGPEAMAIFAKGLAMRMDDHANMDW